MVQFWWSYIVFILLASEVLVGELKGAIALSCCFHKKQPGESTETKISFLEEGKMTKKVSYLIISGVMAPDKNAAE